MVIEEGKKCVNFSKSLRYELKQMVNCPIGLIGKKPALAIPQVHHLLAVLVGMNSGKYLTLGHGMYSSPNSTSEHFFFFLASNEVFSVNLLRTLNAATN